MGSRALYGFQSVTWVPERCMGSRALYGFQSVIWVPEGYMGSRALYGCEGLMVREIQIMKSSATPQNH